MYAIKAYTRRLHKPSMASKAWVRGLNRPSKVIKACARTIAQVRNGLGNRIGEMPWPGKDDPGGRGKQRRQVSDGWRYG